ncbi:MAG: sigma-54 dependent transcriptional regulator [Fibrobacterota bacterium]|nr:sigma-54 dependent transcriptional regulator [Fibrobacterota bacterium]
MVKKLLIIDDERSIVESLTRALMGQDYELSSSLEPEKALEMVKRLVPQVVISDLKMPKLDGLELLGRIKEFNASIQVIMITGHGTIDDAVRAMKKGAYDFIPKPFNKQEIISIVNRAFEKAALLEENFTLREQLKKNQVPSFEMGRSQAFKGLLDRAGQAAASDATILLLGESGTGKEVLAHYIYSRSHRLLQPFVTVNCAAIPEALLEAELFGYKKGAFTGAFQDRKGRFQEAHGGTLFLDEIGEIPLHVQPKLLRILQEGEVNPVGGQSQKVDVRIIAATNKNLRKQVEAGLFREDLFYRLNVIPLQIPPLRQRPEDLHPLIAYFIAQYCRKNKKANLSLSAEALALMEKYPWPGNVRELENAIERAVILCLQHQITPSDLPDELSLIPETSTQISVGKGMTLEEIELAAIQIGLRRNHGDKAKTAEELGISLRTVYRKLDLSAVSLVEDNSLKIVEG